jgi:subtilisin family serine protease
LTSRRICAHVSRIAIVVGLCVLAGVSAARAQEMEPAQLRLDPTLRSLLEDVTGPAPGVVPITVDEELRRQRLDAQAKLIALDAAADPPLVTVLVRTDGREPAFQTAGGHVGAQRDDIYAVELPVPALGVLASLSGVIRVEAAPIFYPDNDVAGRSPAVDGTGAHLVRAETGLDGSAVVIGIIDTGIDPEHQDFRNPDGTTRIEALFDAQG